MSLEKIAESLLPNVRKAHAYRADIESVLCTLKRRPDLTHLNPLPEVMQKLASSLSRE